MRISKIALLTMLVLAAARLLAAADFQSERLNNWHQWRGPLANGFAPHAEPPLSWDEQTNVKWKVAVAGEGSSTPIVWQNRVFLLTAVKTDRKEEAPPEEIAEAPGGNPFRIERPTNYYKFHALCYDRQTGDLLWQRLATEKVPHEGHHHDHGFASSSPVTDGQYVYTSFGSRGVYCYDVSGNLKWQRELGTARMYRFFGEASSPVLHHGTLIVNFDHEGDSFLIALDARTGETIWKVDRNERSSWATPLVVEYDGQTQIVVNANGKARGYEFETGEVLWECGGQTLAIIPCPVAFDGLVFCMSGYPGSALVAIPLDARGDITGTDKIAWQHNQNTPYCPSPLLYGDRLWFNKSNRSVITCLDARTGEPILETQRLSGLRGIYASPVGADGRIYITGRSGATVVIADEPELNVLATNRLEDDIDASPALVDREVFLRGRKHLYCIAEE